MALARLALALVFCLVAGFPTLPSASAAALPPGPIVVNHDSVSLFEEIPSQYFSDAQSTTMFFTDRSVGMNVNDGLDCLAGPHESARSHCKRYIHVDPTYNTTPEDVYWPGSYPRPNWRFVLCTELGCTFDEYGRSPTQAFGYFPSYLEAPAIADTFFTSSADGEDVYDLVAFGAAHPETTVIYFTSSLARGESEATEHFNQQMRSFASTNGLVLFDIADILSHKPSGAPCYDNRDGVAYSSGPRSENYPDDGINTEAICPEYTTEVEGGHLGSVSAGKIRVAKAFWVLMAQIAGWQPGSVATATPAPTATRTNTPLPTATRTSTPLPTATRTNTPLPTATRTNTPLPTAAPTNTPLPTAAPTNTPLPTAAPTSTPIPTAAPTNTPQPTAPPTDPPFVKPTRTPRPSPTATPTMRLIATPPWNW